jgi:transcription factor C subunit 7
MVVTEILLLRHGHRLAWTLDPSTGKYTSNHPFPTRLPADPPLAAHGARQAAETGAFFHKTLLDPARNDRLRIYSSLFYRCLETLRPTVEKLRAEFTDDTKILKSLEVRGERGLGEWFGHAWFKQPVPGTPAMLKEKFFPWLDEHYSSRIIPDGHGERIETLHSRIAKALEEVVRYVDKEFADAGRAEEEVTLLICGHAAQIICSGRALTGQMPEDLDEEDFQCYTCGISKFRKRTDFGDGGKWNRRLGVAGGWDCVLNSECSHLSEGEERGWHFHGDESFDSYGGALGPRTSNGGVKESHLERNEDSNETWSNTAKL